MNVYDGKIRPFLLVEGELLELQSSKSAYPHNCGICQISEICKGAGVQCDNSLDCVGLAKLYDIKGFHFVRVDK